MPPLKKTMSGNKSSKPESSRSLFGDTGVDVSKLDGDKKTLQETERYRTQYIDIDKIRFYEYNKFRALDTTRLEKSISLVGVMEPIILITKKDDKGEQYFEVIAGSRRLTSVINLHKQALVDNDQINIKKFQKIFSIVLPSNATKSEIDAVYKDTNTTHRPMSIDDMFLHLEDFLKKDENGEFINLPEGRINVAKLLQYEFKSLGYDYGMTKIKVYVSIYLAHNKQIQKDLQNKTLTLTQAYTVSQMPDAMQDSVMKQFETMTDKEIKDYIKTYNLGLKVKKISNKRSIDVIYSLNKITEDTEMLSSIDKIILVKKEDKFVINKTIDDLIKKLQIIKEKTTE